MSSSVKLLFLTTGSEIRLIYCMLLCRILPSLIQRLFEPQPTRISGTKMILFEGFKQIDADKICSTVWMIHIYFTIQITTLSTLSETGFLWSFEWFPRITKSLIKWRERLVDHGGFSNLCHWKFGKKAFFFCVESYL